MLYTKPVVLSTRAAASAIQGIGKLSTNNEVDQPSEAPAYEADE